MGMVCEICSKGKSVGNNVSHANNKTKRSFYPNLKRVRVMKGKSTLHLKVCTRCIRSGKIKKAV